jgi:hypothetical protein
MDAFRESFSTIRFRTGLFYLFGSATVFPQSHSVFRILGVEFVEDIARASLRATVDETDFSRVLDQFRSGPATELALDLRAMRLGGAKAHIAKARDFLVGVAERQ